MGKMKINEIAGYEKEKEEILGLRKMLHEFDKYRGLGVRIPHGLMISGVPGVGKTALMRALPDSGIHIYNVENNGNSFADTLMKTIKAARKNPPAVIMIDEFDKIIGGQKFIFGDADDESMPFIRCIENLTDDDAVLIVATCNDLHGLDQALLRAGRFDRIMEIQLPDEPNRIKIAEKYLKQLKIRKEITADYISKMTVGMSCADIEAIINEAGIIATEKPEPVLTIVDFRLALNRSMFSGCEQGKTRSAEEEYKIAVHEAGHTLVAMKIAQSCLYEASILEQGSTAGHIKLLPDDTRSISVKDMENRIIVALAGHVAEREVLGEYYLSSNSDLLNAIETLQKLVVDHAAYGYSGLVSQLSIGHIPPTCSPEYSAKRDALIERKLNEFDSAADRIINENRELLDRIITALVKDKVLSREELMTIAGGNTPSIVSDQKEKLLGRKR